MTDVALAQARSAARGMLHIVAQHRGSLVRQRLAYEALYACGFDGRGKLERFRSPSVVADDVLLWESITTIVPDAMRVRGWRIDRLDGERVVVERDGVRAFVERNTLPLKIRRGGRVSISLPAVHRPLGGFIRRYDEQWESVNARPISRFYLNVSPHLAPWVLGSLFRHLCAVTPIAAKVLAHRAAYRRRDAAVLYVPSEKAGVALGALLRRMAFDNVRLPRSVPLFTFPVAPGVGFADEPSDLGVRGVSHGRWVSSVFAQATARCHDVDVVVDRVQRAIRRFGRDPRNPWLRAASDPHVMARLTTYT